MIATRMEALGADVVEGTDAGATTGFVVAADSTVAAGARLTDSLAGGAGGALIAIEVEGAVCDVGEEPDLGWSVATSQCSLCGVKATLSPFIPVTRRPFTAVPPEPRSELSGSTARVNGPPEFST